MKKWVIAAVIVLAMVILLGFFKLSGYASWSHQSQSINNKLNNCEDTDSGKDYTTPGTATWTWALNNKKYTYKDFCSLGLAVKTRITEYYCTAQNTASPISYNCAAIGKTCKSGPDGAYCG
ncbi:hypothetical protein J4447_01115 [Candidatus Pacearchaeota archaeon]|nr:hypothetical protein [Candidatus Pacearchaeota archaeon]